LGLPSGPGYRHEIERWTGGWFGDPKRQERYEFLEEEMQRRWRDMLSKLEN
jgi:hypothetical protein